MPCVQRQDRRAFVGAWTLGSVLGIALAVSIGCTSVKLSEPTAGESVEAFTGPTMGTQYTVRYGAATCCPNAEILQSYVDRRLAEINERMSTYDPESELSRFNRHSGDDWFAVSEETAKVVAYALEIAAETNGAFDPTVGPAVNLWGFGPDGRLTEPPTDEGIEDAAKLVDYTKVEARLSPPALRKTDPQVYVDLSAVAKGYGSDAIGQLLSDNGVENYMVEIGGEVATRGSKADGSPWRIGIEKPQASARSLQTVVELAGEALATSGDYRNFFEDDDVRYSHTIDPTTGRPVTHNLATVSVRASTCMEADAQATALLVMGRQRGYDWAEERGIAALMIERTDNGPVESQTSAW
ncbi:MAG: FAD:protein FMN transferase [Planctomycetota bacterium]